MTLRLKKRYRLEKVVCKCESRPALMSIKIEGDRAIATDGNILASVPIENSNGKRKLKDRLLSSAAWLRAVKKKSKDDSYLVEAKPDELTKEQYVNWRSVVPDGEKHTLQIGLNTDYLYDLSQALGGDGRVVLSIDPENSSGSILVKPFLDIFDDEKEEKNPAFGLIMPNRLEEDISKEKEQKRVDEQKKTRGFFTREHTKPEESLSGKKYRRRKS